MDAFPYDGILYSFHFIYLPVLSDFAPRLTPDSKSHLSGITGDDQLMRRYRLRFVRPLFFHPDALNWQITPVSGLLCYSQLWLLGLNLLTYLAAQELSGSVGIGCYLYR
jgi:hypothetical protein